MAVAGTNDRLFICIFPSMTISSFFFFNDTATTEIYTLSLHDALPISRHVGHPHVDDYRVERVLAHSREGFPSAGRRLHRSEEHTSELQSQSNLVCRLLLEKKNMMRRSSSSKRQVASLLLVVTSSRRSM